MQHKDSDERQRKPRYVPRGDRQLDAEDGDDRKPSGDRITEVHELLEPPYDDCA